MSFAKDRGGDLEGLADHRLRRERPVLDNRGDLQDRNAAKQAWGSQVGCRPGCRFGYTVALARSHQSEATRCLAEDREMVGSARLGTPGALAVKETDRVCKKFPVLSQGALMVLNREGSPAFQGPNCPARADQRAGRACQQS